MSTNKIIIKPYMKTIHKIIRPNNITESIENKDLNNIKEKTFVKSSFYKKIGKIEPIYKDQTIFLIGGGPSLKDFDFSLLNNKIKIAINKAFLFVPNAEVLYWTDIRFYTWYTNEIDNFKGLKVTNKSIPLKDDIINLIDTGREGLELNPTGLRHGNNSGYAAINLAVHLGASKIVLLGYDMKTINNNTHWHDGYNIQQSSKIYQNNMIPHFNTLIEPLNKLNIEIWNANLDSNLTCFQKCSPSLAVTF